MQKYILIYLLILLCSIACKTTDKTKTTQKVDNITLSPIKTLDKIDTIFIGKISSIMTQEGIIMMGDSKKHRVLVTNMDFKLKHILGKQGNGPGEFSNTQHHLIKNNLIYANDLGNHRLNMFNKDNAQFIKSIKLGDRGNLVTSQFYFDDNNNIYFSTDPEPSGKMLLRLDSNGKVVKRFGDILKKSNDITEQMNTNYKEMILYKNRIVTVGRTIGIVEIYDLEGNKINSFDISKYEPIKTNTELVKKDIKENPNSTNVLHGFCYVRGDKLYIGPADWTPNLINKRDVMVFRWSDTSCELIKTINFKTNKDDNMTLFEPYFISEDEKTIYAQGGSTKKLYVFKMP